MNLEKSSARATGSNDDIYNRIFSELPPLGSTENRTLLESASATDLPAQVLARAFRQLVVSGSEVAANATLARLVSSKKYDYGGKAVYKAKDFRFGRNMKTGTVNNRLTSHDKRHRRNKALT